MTARELALFADAYTWQIAAFLVVLPTLPRIIGSLHSPGSGGLSPWCYLYSAVVYLACVPGIFAAVFTGYLLFFTRHDLLDVNLFISILPIISMTATLVLVSKSVSFDDVPGFDRLSGLMVVIAVTFILALAIRKTRIWLVFGDSVLTLAVLVLGLFALLKWGTYMLFRRKDEPRSDPPSLRMR